MSKPGYSVSLSDRRKRLRDRSFESSPCPRSYGPQRRLDLRPAALYRVKIARRGRQVYPPCSASPYGFPYAGDFMRPQIVPHHNVSLAQRRTQDALYISPKDCSVRCSLHCHQRRQATSLQASSHREGRPVGCGNAPAGPLSARSPSIQSRQSQLHARFINDFASAQIQFADSLGVRASGLLPSWGSSFRGVERLFFRGSPSLCNPRHRVEREAFFLCLRPTWVQASSRVLSLLCSTSWRTKAQAFSLREGLLPPA